MMPALDPLIAAVEKAVPLPGRFRSALPQDTAELSRLLTAARGEREGGYLNRPRLLSAYLRYFLPWNVFRLVKLFEAAGPPCTFAGGDAVTDLGSGPLSLPIALWFAFPGLRRLNLEFRCVDKSAPALEAGRRIFDLLAGGERAWRIKTIHGPLETPIRGKGAKLVSALNVFNEAYRRIEPGTAERAAALLASRSADDGAILVMEPGNPQGGAFTAALRNALLEKGRPPLAPCPHCSACPMPGVKTPGVSIPGTPGRMRGTKAKWCHFAFDTGEAPAALHKLSAAAGLPKERAVFSFLVAGPAAGAGVSAKADDAPDIMRIRIISDPFPAGGQWGRYGCSVRGLTLVMGSKAEVSRIAPLSVMEAPSKNTGRDPKTGALVVPL